MAPDDSGWRRLAEYVAKRRTQLGMTQGEVHAAGGPSVATMRLIEGAMQQSYRQVILGRLEEALRWQTGSVAAILVGGEPTPVERTDTRQPPMDPDVLAILRRLANPDVPDEQKAAIRQLLRSLDQLPVPGHAGTRTDRRAS